MSTYLFSIETAAITFPIIAFLLAIPYMIYQYHKYGSIPWLRTLIIYSFFLYLLVIYYLAILPLPDPEEVAKLTTPRYQPLPFYFIIDIIKNADTSLHGTALVINVIKNPEFYTTFLNILMFIPFGVYMHYYFKLSLKKTILYSFLLSLFIELTQLSGLYFIYPRPYRLFDVDDLMINTLGGLSGYLIAPLFTFFLPSRETIDKTSIKKAENVKFFRRLAALIIDYIVIQLLLTIISFFINLSTIDTYGLFYFLYFFLSVTFTKGFTIGKRIVNIKIIGVSEHAGIWQYALRYFLLYVVTFQAFTIGVDTLSYLLTNTIEILPRIALYGFVILCFLINIVFFVELLISVFRKNYRFLYEKLSKTKNISTFHDETTNTI